VARPHLQNAWGSVLHGKSKLSNAYQAEVPSGRNRRHAGGRCNGSHFSGKHHACNGRGHDVPDGQSPRRCGHLDQPVDGCAGSRVWQNGPGITPGVNLYGYQLVSIDWYGTYNSGGSWLGAGMNYHVTPWGGWWTFTCASRWYINAWGNVTSFNRGC